MSAPPGYRLRQVINIVALGSAGLCALLTVGVLFGLLGYIVYHGIAGLSWDFLTKLPKPVGEEGGGMANAIVGSLKLLLLAGLIGIPIGFLGGVYLAEFGRGKLGFFVRYAADVLAGVPSIVVGIVVYSLVVLPMRGFSALAGGVALGIMMIPITIRSTEELLRTVPTSVREAALSLGIREWRGHRQRGHPHGLARPRRGDSPELRQGGGGDGAAAFHRPEQPLLERRLDRTHRLSARDDLHLRDRPL